MRVSMPVLRKWSFNEAAGIPRGRQTIRLWRLQLSRGRFNEAAGIPRGRHTSAPDSPAS